MNTQTLYNQLVSREISEQKFLYEVRRDPLLTMIHPTNSLTDTVSILKRHKVIYEVKEKNPEVPEVISLTIDQVSPYEYAKGINAELGLTYTSAGNSGTTYEELLAAQKKVLQNLTSEPYYYTKKAMSDEEKTQEKNNFREEELGKTKNAPNQMEKGKVLKEHFEDYGHEEGQCEGCEREELDIEMLSPEKKQILGEIIEEWSLTEYDLNDDDVLDELAEELERRSNGETVDEGIAIKDKAGNVQYAKDDNEATQVINNARTKNVILTKTRV